MANHFGRDTHIEHLVSQFNLASILTTFTNIFSISYADNLDKLSSSGKRVTGHSNVARQCEQILFIRLCSF